MSLKLTRYKPDLGEGAPLCAFRSSKAYLWGIVRQELKRCTADSTVKKDVLDAACHALITKDMFPANLNYFGLDIAYSRLQQALKTCNSNDQFYCADLTKPLNLAGCFDIVVSCNTLSHLHVDQKDLAIDQLLNSCKKGGDFIVNTTIDEWFHILTAKLIDKFDSVWPIYFDSIYSHGAEESGLVNEKNVRQYIHEYEQSLPNDAAIHRQVLFIAKNHLKGSAGGAAPPKSKKGSILLLNDVPRISKLVYNNDQHLLKAEGLWANTKVAIGTNYLLDSAFGARLKDALGELGVNLLPLKEWELVADKTENIVILGLENEWIGNQEDTRVELNKIKRYSKSSMVFAIVKERGEVKCKESLVAGDM